MECSFHQTPSPRFDIIDKEIIANNKLKKVSDYSFLHLGQSIHADTIKEFLKEKKLEKVCIN